MRKFDPLKRNHPLVANCTLCPVCGDPFETGDETTLVELWPADKEEARKAQEERVYLAEAKPVHWGCRGN